MLWGIKEESEPLSLMIASFMSKEPVVRGTALLIVFRMVQMKKEKQRSHKGSIRILILT
jgi:hypothetical protein